MLITRPVLTAVGKKASGIGINLIPGVVFFCITFSSINLIAQEPIFIYGNQYTTDHYQEVFGISTDTSGAVYTAGVFSGTVNFNPVEGSPIIKTSNGLSDIFITKTNREGNTVWVKTIGGPDIDYVNSFTIINNNGIILTGNFRGSVDFDPGNSQQILTSYGGEDIFVLTLDLSGSFASVNSFGGANNDAALNIQTDAENNIFICGYFSESVDFDLQSGSQIKTSQGLKDMFIAKYFADGNLAYVTTFGSTGNELLTNLVINKDGSVYTAGTFNRSITVTTDAGMQTLQSKGSTDVFLASIAANGAVQYVSSFGGKKNDDVTCIKSDDAKRIYICGSFSDTVNFGNPFNQQQRIALGASDLYVLKLSELAEYENVFTAGSKQTDKATSLLIGDKKQIVTIGFFQDTLQVATQSGIANLISRGLTDPFIIKLDSLTNFQWAGNAGSAGNDVLTDFTIDKKAQIFTTGFSGPQFSADFTGNTNILPGNAPFNILNLRYNNCLAPSTPTIIAPVNGICPTEQVVLRLTNNELNSAYYWEWRSGNCNGPLLGTGDSLIVQQTATTKYYVKGAGGCISASVCGTATVPISGCFSVNASIDSINCIGGSVKLEAQTVNGEAPFTYSIDGINFTGQQVFNVTAGTYTVFAKDAIGRSANSQPYVITPACFNVRGQADSVACFGGNTVLNAITQNGEAPFEYSIDNINFITDPFFTVPAGTYTIYARDVVGRKTISAPYSVLQPTQIKILGACYSPSLKYLGVQAAGGTQPYQFSRNGTTYFNGSQRNGTAYVFLNTNPNVHTLRVRDSKGCEIALQIRTDTLPVCPQARPASFAGNSTNTNSLNAAAVYAVVKPNPSANYFEVNVNDYALKKILVVDALGNIVFAKETKESKLVIGDNWLPGMYILQVIENNLIRQYKLVKL